MQEGTVVKVLKGHKSVVGKLCRVSAVWPEDDKTFLELSFMKDDELYFMIGSTDTVERIPTPNPGSDQALSVGCRCPVLDNAHGRGGNPCGFWIAANCPVHGAKAISN